MIYRLVLPAMLFVGVVAFVGPLEAGSGKSGKKTADPQTVTTDLKLIASLQATYQLIDKADPIYQGHRAKAKHEINAAIGELQKEAAKHGLKQHHKDTGKEPVAVSDAQIKQSLKEVKALEVALATLPKSKHRVNAAKHLSAAANQLGLALAVVHKKK